MGHALLTALNDVMNRILESAVFGEASALADPKAIRIKLSNIPDGNVLPSMVVAAVVAIFFEPAKYGGSRTPKSGAKLLKSENQRCEKDLFD